MTFYALAAACSLLAAAAWCLARPHLLASLSVAVASVLWVLLNGPLEGRVLYTVTPERGLTEADLLSAVGMVIAVWGYRVGVRDRRRRSHRTDTSDRRPDNEPPRRELHVRDR